MTAKAAIIIPAYGDLAGLQACIDALAAQTEPDFEAIVCDNNTEPPLAPRLPDARFRLVREARPGSYAARNRAMQDATAPTLAFTDADCLPSPTWVEEGLRAVAGEPDAVHAGHVQMFPKDPARPTWVERYEMQWGLRQDIAIREGGYAVTANLWVTRAVFDAVGPFDADLASGGDREWSQRAAAAGHPILYAPTAIVHHPARSTWQVLATKVRRVQAGAFALGDASAEHQRGLASILIRGTMPPLAHSFRLRREAPDMRLLDRLRIAAVHWRVKWTKMRVILAHRKAQR